MRGTANNTGEKGQASPKRLNQNLLSPGRRESVAVLVPVSTRGSRLTSSSDLALFKVMQVCALQITH